MTPYLLILALAFIGYAFVRLLRSLMDALWDTLTRDERED